MRYATDCISVYRLGSKGAACECHDFSKLVETLMWPLSRVNESDPDSGVTEGNEQPASLPPGGITPARERSTPR